jgi:hypothetical protein
MAKYVVGEFSFASKQAVRRLLSSALEELEDGEQVTDPFVADLLTALAREHPEAADKIGEGIEYWIAASNKDIGYATRGFRAKQRGRAEPVRFSYTDVLSPPKQRALWWLRPSRKRPWTSPDSSGQMFSPTARFSVQSLRR